MMATVLRQNSGYTLDVAFPKVDPGVVVFGNKVLLQVRLPRSVSAGGLIMIQEARDDMRWNTQIAKVISMGPLAYHTRDVKMEPWPEGAWCKVGDFVRIPLHGGDRWEVEHDRERVAFRSLSDREILGLVTGDPLLVTDYMR